MIHWPPSIYLPCPLSFPSKASLLVHEDQQSRHINPQPVIVRKKRGGCLRVVLIGGAVLAGLAVVGALLSGGGGTSGDPDDTTVSDSSAPSGERNEPKSTGIGDTVRDGKFSFKITKVDKGLTQVGKSFTISKAQGQYVLVYVTVRNIG